MSGHHSRQNCPRYEDGHKHRCQTIQLHRFGIPWGNEYSGYYVSEPDTQSGRLIRTYRVAPTRGVAVDDQTGYAFVTNWDDNSVSMLDATR